MNVKGLFRIFSDYLLMLALFTGIGLAVSIYFQYFVLPVDHPAPHPTEAFLLTILIAIFAAVCLKILAQGADKAIHLQEAILLVVGIWLITSIIGALPFTLSGTLDHFIDAWFESVSGLTTTGSSILHPKAYASSGQEIPYHMVYTAFQKIEYTFYGTVKPVIDATTGQVLLTGIEAVPKALLFWRSFLHWYGGMGIVLLFVALLPALGVQARALFRYESTGPLFSPLFPKVRQTAIVLLKIYVILTLACLISLLVTNPAMSFFDALNISFSTISTGGFAPKNTSVGYYNSAWTDYIVLIFMISGGVNFALYYDWSKGRFYRLLDPEFLLFLGMIVVFCGIASWGIYGAKKVLLTGATNEVYSLADSIRYGSFQVVSCMTNTGFATCDYDHWPAISQTIMLIVMYLGGMAGSTSGGLKTIRVFILLKYCRTAISSVFRRNEVQILRVGNREIDKETITGVLAFFLVMVLSSIIGILMLLGDGVDIETALGLNGCMINNTGNAFRVAGPTESCAFMSPFGKTVCIIWMFIGRLEYYAWFALFLPSFWKKC